MILLGAMTTTMGAAALMGTGVWLLLAMLVILIVVLMPMNMAAAITTTQCIDDQGGRKTYTTKASTAIAQNLRVKLDGSNSDTIDVAGTGEADEWIGTTMDNYASDAAGKKATVRLRNHEGTHEMVASGAITAGAPVYGAAGGKISATGSGDRIGVALSSATADGDIIEVLVAATRLLKSVAASVAAAGANAGNATALGSGSDVYPVTAADDAKGVIMSALDNVTGNEIMVANLVSNKILLIYPPTGGTINGAAANAAYSTASGKGARIVCLDSTANAGAGSYAALG